MLEEQAIVVSVDQRSVWVETQRQSACGQCAANKGCGSAVLQKVFGNKRNILPVTGDMPVKVGDQVIIGLNEDALFKGSMMVYALPILLMIVFAIIGETIASHTLSMNSDFASVAGALLGLLVGVAGLRWYTARIAGNTLYQPVLLRPAGVKMAQPEIRILN